MMRINRLYIDCENQFAKPDAIIIILTLPGYSERTRLQLPCYQLFADQIYFFYKKLHIHQVQSFQEDKDMVSQVSGKNVHHSSKTTMLLSLMENGQLPANVINTMIKTSKRTNLKFILAHIVFWNYATIFSYLKTYYISIMASYFFQHSKPTGFPIQCRFRTTYEVVIFRTQSCKYFVFKIK